jgi:mRNA interferase MazF
MVKQGDIIKLDFDPIVGHEQSGYRPAVVVSNSVFGRSSIMVYVCPVTNTFRNSPLHVKIDNHLTTGYIMCDNMRAVDLAKRGFTAYDRLDLATLVKVITTIQASVDIKFQIYGEH